MAFRPVRIHIPSREEFWNRWRRLAGPSLFFLAVIYYEELFLKLYCFHGVSLPGLLFTLLFSAPPALVLGALCGGAGRRWGPGLLVGLTALISLWMGSQTIYYHLFKTFLTLFSLTKMAMVAGAFGDMAVGEILLNWFPILMMAVPVVLAFLFRNRVCSGQPLLSRMPLECVGLAAAVQLIAMGIVLCCGSGVLSLRYIYYQAAAPVLEVQNFGMLTQTQLEVRRVLFGIQPDDLHHAVFDEKLSGSRIVEVTLPGYLYAPFVLNDNPVRAEIPHDLVAGKRGIGLPVGLPLVHKRERMSQFPPTDNRLGRRRRAELSLRADCVAGKRGKISLPRSGTDFQSNRTLPGKQPAEIELRPVAKYSDRQSQRNLTFVTFDPVERIGPLETQAQGQGKHRGTALPNNPLDTLPIRMRKRVIHVQGIERLALQQGNR